MKIGIISGSGFYDIDSKGVSESLSIQTEFGKSEATKFCEKDKEIYFISRHGKCHSLLPNMVNYRANILVMKETGVDIIIGTSIMGILDPKIELATLMLFEDLFFLDNRLPNGEICSIFSEEGKPGRGHYMFGHPFSTKANEITQKICLKNDIPYSTGLIHAHVNGPRFNSKCEISYLKAGGATTVSQTVGPEIILAGECEIPYLLLGFGVDYANGIKQEATPIGILNKNMNLSKTIFSRTIFGIIEEIQGNKSDFYNGFVYKFS